ncbi:MAG: hypothetical protein ACREQV_20125, partial [Candidatus Binatia bacterium]
SYYRNPDLQSIDKWKTSLTPGQQLSICKAFRGNENLASLGYDFSSSGLEMDAVRRWRGHAGRLIISGRMLLTRIIRGVSRRTLRLIQP